ncbi:MAG TPA: transcription antitermination factor NusB [Acidimicrobiales bacterium]|nr:transcription antitermination factor NusB [Acidimicrobiales bacterium]
MSDFEPSEVESRRGARERALELLYEAEAKGISVEEVLAGLPVAPVEMAVELVRGVAAHAERIDEIVTRRVAPRWTLARLAALDRAVLRLGTYELLERPDRSQAVIINEAVVLARRYGTDASPRFVNGVLSAVAAEVRGDEPARRRPVQTGDAGAPIVEALIIDLDGVIRHWDDDDLPAIDRAHDLPAGTVAAAAFSPERLDAAMRGDITFEDWCQSVGDAVADAHAVDGGTVSKAFADTGWQIDAQVLDLVDRVRARFPVALLSNASTRLVDDLRASGIADRFDVVVGSADIGVCKPDPAAFVEAAERLGVPAGRCLLVDDQPANVEGARAAGMCAELYAGPESLAAALAAVGLLDDAV